MSSFSTPLVRVSPSSLCEGQGLFAQRDIPKGSYITAYAGRRMCDASVTKRTRSRIRATSDYEYMASDGTTIDGAEPGTRWWSRRGIAQMANDAIHESVSGRSNNCDFSEVCVDVSRDRSVTRVFLMATRDIRKDEELLVPYSMGYWLYRIRSPTDPELSRRHPDLCNWLRCHEALERHALRNGGLGRGCWIEEFLDLHSEAQRWDPETGEMVLKGTARYILSQSCDVHPNCSCALARSEAEAEEEEEEEGTRRAVPKVDVILERRVAPTSSSSSSAAPRAASAAEDDDHKTHAGDDEGEADLASARLHCSVVCGRCQSFLFEKRDVPLIW